MKSHKVHGKWISIGYEPATMCGFVCQKRNYTLATSSMLLTTSHTAAISSISISVTESSSIVVYRNDSEYLIQTEKDPGINFTSARQTCHQWGGELTHIRNAQENSFIAGTYT